MVRSSENIKHEGRVQNSIEYSLTYKNKLYTHMYTCLPVGMKTKNDFF